MDAHRLSKISSSFSPLTDKEAPAAGWPLLLLCYYLYENVFFLNRLSGGSGGGWHIMYASTTERDPPMCACIGVPACVCVWERERKRVNVCL